MRNTGEFFNAGRLKHRHHWLAITEQEFKDQTLSLWNLIMENVIIFDFTSWAKWHIWDSSIKSQYTWIMQNKLSETNKV